MRTWRRAIVACVGWALVANLVAWCPCAQAMPPSDAGHGCCAPASGWRDLSADCCSSKAPSSQNTSTQAPAVAAEIGVAVLPSPVSFVSAVVPASRAGAPAAVPFVLRI